MLGQVTCPNLFAEFFTITNGAETAHTPDEQQLVDVAAILAAGIIRLRERDSLPECKQAGNPDESSADRFELSCENVLTVVHGG